MLKNKNYLPYNRWNLKFLFTKVHNVKSVRIYFQDEFNTFEKIIFIKNKTKK